MFKIPNTFGPHVGQHKPAADTLHVIVGSGTRPVDAPVATPAVSQQGVMPSLAQTRVGLAERRPNLARTYFIYAAHSLKLPHTNSVNAALFNAQTASFILLRFWFY